MKKLIVATVIAGLILTSCQKADKEELSPATETAASATSSAATASGWIAVTFNPGAAGAKGQVQSQASVSSEMFSEAVLADGLVLVFSKDDKGVNMLPYQDAATDWNYTVSKGQLSISATAVKAVESASVRYIVLEAAKVAELEKTGYSRADLINLPFEKAQVLFGLQ
ncbi:MAG: hypothetical protein EOO09_06550 [Chitinophagaceae bacterium]|nr:MAG: hypothetical protein EOO09_06550 [Chitinophagaceae bacterium]